MTVLNIKVQSMADVSQNIDGEPVFLTREDYIDQKQTIPVERVAILEGGMQSGKTSIGFVLPVPDENGEVGEGSKYMFVEMSAEQLLALAGAVNGAVERFGG